MHYIYRVTNKVTHARMVCVARSEADAIRTHPTDPCARHTGSGWVRDTGGHFARLVAVPAPEGWTAKLELLCADEIGLASGEWCAIVEAYQPSLDLRRGAPSPEGPDDTWGGYTLDDL